MLVDNDADPKAGGSLDEREPIIVRSLGVAKLPAGVTLRLSTAAEGALNFSVLRRTAQGYVKVLGRLPSEPPQSLITKADDVDPSGETFTSLRMAFRARSSTDSCSSISN